LVAWVPMDWQMPLIVGHTLLFLALIA